MEQVKKSKGDEELPIGKDCEFLHRCWDQNFTESKKEYDARLRSPKYDKIITCRNVNECHKCTAAGKHLYKEVLE